MLCISCYIGSVYRLWLHNTHKNDKKTQKLHIWIMHVSKLIRISIANHKECNVWTTICSGPVRCTPEIIFRRWEIITDFGFVHQKNVVHGWKAETQQRCKFTYTFDACTVPLCWFSELSYPSNNFWPQRQKLISIESVDQRYQTNFNFTHIVLSGLQFSIHSDAITKWMHKPLCPIKILCAPQK